MINIMFFTFYSARRRWVGYAIKRKGTGGGQIPVPYEKILNYKKTKNKALINTILMNPHFININQHCHVRTYYYPGSGCHRSDYTWTLHVLRSGAHPEALPFF